MFSGAEKYCVGMGGGFFGKGSDVQASETDERALAAIVVCDAVGAVGVGDVDLDYDQVGGIVDGERLDMFVDDDGVVIGSQICGEGGETERRKQRILDRAPIGAGCFCECGENEFDVEGTCAGSDHRVSPVMRGGWVGGGK